MTNIQIIGRFENGSLQIISGSVAYCDYGRPGSQEQHGKEEGQRKERVREGSLSIEKSISQFFESTKKMEAIHRLKRILPQQHQHKGSEGCYQLIKTQRLNSLFHSCKISGLTDLENIGFLIFVRENLIKASVSKTFHFNSPLILNNHDH